MHMHELPQEILCTILLEVARINETEGERYTYGLSQAPLPAERAKLTKYVRGPLSAESIRWDATRSIRQVCAKWHSWAIAYNIEHVFERRWRGSERWADLTLRRPSYGLYEMITTPRGVAVYRDPYSNLKQTDALFTRIPEIATNVRRLWFNGFYAEETDRHILSIISECPNLELLSVPWTVARRGTPTDWIDLLNVGTGVGKPLYSLEIQGICLPMSQATDLEQDDTPDPLQDSRVDFSQLKRLKIFGNTLHKPICDFDLATIARSGTNLTCLDLTNISTVSVAGLLTLVKASALTLEVLEHSPRSSDGFFHPHQGRLESGEHICELLTSLPKMRDLSISIPNMCADLFSNPLVNWSGECLIRAVDICPHDSLSRLEALSATLQAARRLIAARERVRHQLHIELFFAGCIFEPEKKLVHGDFTMASLVSYGQWPISHEPSGKGPYGSSGYYGKEEEGWVAVTEKDYLYAVGRGWVMM
ncbi:hypothetical protein B0A48_13692 [Cryoendolithus antarcticus]|uniref:Uncharacterized protein n=1 Tax=Cryoendolithus antarcticus TaxID=1507870 RepID=A0A1V8SMF4_9PEZI|nr:hypothetical protein B0A48_13692 [Cryoendolithus antarcticus]